MAWVERGTIQGPPGTFDTATAETIPFDDDPTVVLGGTAANRTVHFRIPAGIPHPDAVPADAAVAAFVNTPGTDTADAVDAFVNIRNIEMLGELP